MAKSCRKPAPRTFGSDFKAGPSRFPVPPPKADPFREGRCRRRPFPSVGEGRPAALSGFGPQSRTCRRASGKAPANRQAATQGVAPVRPPERKRRPKGHPQAQPYGDRDAPVRPARKPACPGRASPDPSRASSVTRLIGAAPTAPGRRTAGVSCKGIGRPSCERKGPAARGSVACSAPAWRARGAPAGPPVGMIRGGFRQRPRTKRPAKSAANAPQS